MTVQSPPSTPDPAVHDAPAGTPATPVAPDAPRGRLGRVTAGSLILGGGLALVLSAVVLAGSAEHVVTGTALLGLSLGWALLAVLSAHLTTQPQRWAFVPAAALAAAGAGLLVAAPDDGALTSLGWVWPPVMLAVAVWAAIHARRSLHTRARAWLVYPALALLALAAVGGAAQTARVTADAAATVPGASYDVGGYDLHLTCTGQGSPTVVLEYGLGGSAALWGRVAERIGTTTRVCAYDRAGVGASGSADHPHDALEITADLHALLHAAGETGPYVVVGHSSGGAYAMTYAARYPGEVAGLVLLDASNPYAVTAESATAPVRPAAVGPLGLLPTLARAGLTQLLPTRAWSDLPAPYAEQYRAAVATARGASTMVGEVTRYDAAFAQAQALTTLGDTPLAVVTTADNERSGGAGYAAQQRLARLSTTGSLRVVDSSHAGLLDEPRGAGYSSDAIEDVVRSVRAAG